MIAIAIVAADSWSSYKMEQFFESIYCFMKFEQSWGILATKSNIFLYYTFISLAPISSMNEVNALTTSETHLKMAN